MLIFYRRKYTRMDKRKPSLLKRAKDEIELDRMNKQKQDKVMSIAQESSIELKSSLLLYLAAMSVYNIT